MQLRSLARRLLPLLIILLVCSRVTAASEREKWIVGRWTSHIEGRPDRTIVFHADHSWGVEGYGAPGPDGKLAIYEDIRGRRWDIRGDTLVLRAPSDDGFESYGEKIISFRQDKIVTDIATYTREQPRE
jgi:hypothetical protein